MGGIVGKLGKKQKKEEMGKKERKGRRKGDRRTAELYWGEPKRGVSLLITPTASDLLAAIAEVLGTTKSEALERLIRAGIGFSRGGFLPALKILDNCLSIQIEESASGAASGDVAFFHQLRGDVLQAISRLSPPNSP